MIDSDAAGRRPTSARWVARGPLEAERPRLVCRSAMTKGWRRRGLSRGFPWANGEQPGGVVRTALRRLCVLSAVSLVAVCGTATVPGAAAVELASSGATEGSGSEVLVLRHPVYAGMHALFGTCPDVKVPPATVCEDTSLLVFRGSTVVGGGSVASVDSRWQVLSLIHI